ncbi:MAG: alpha/beta fold hydrolase [Burkholderiaceae bacterium]
MTLSYAPFIVGSGPHKVICLHGWFGHARGWGPFIDHLDRQAFTYAFIDYRGYGRRRGSGGPYTMEQIAHDTLEVAADLGWDTFSLIGHSMGGMAIQRVLLQAPHKVQALVGVTPVPASGVPFDDAGWQFFSSAAGHPDTRREIINLTTGNRLTRVWLDAMVQDSLEQSEPDAVQSYLKAWARTDFADQITGNAVPVLVVAGEHDPALGEKTCQATWMAHYPNATLHTLANAGHYPMNETPLALITLIERFLDGVVCGSRHIPN